MTLHKSQLKVLKLKEKYDAAWLPLMSFCVDWNNEGMNGGWMNRYWFIIPPLLRYHMCSRKANCTWVSDISLYVIKQRLFWDEALPENGSRWCMDHPCMFTTCQTYKHAAKHPLKLSGVVRLENLWTKMPPCVFCWCNQNNRRQYISVRFSAAP